MKCLSRSLAMLLAAACLLAAPDAEAQLQRNPTGVNVATSGATTLVIRFADASGTRYTTSEAIFCSIDPNAGTGGIGPLGCAAAGGAVLGRLPASLDRGSQSSGTSQITDVMTIPASVSRRAVVLARDGNFSDFFYVRKFDPVGGGASVYVSVTCRLTAGTARTPLSLTRVELYGDEPTDPRNPLIRLNETNIQSGVVRAEIRFTGTGILEGWWEVRTPADPAIREIDRFTPASLSEADRAQQRIFTRVKRFRVNLPLDGTVTLDGPSYAELPDTAAGVYEILLRIDVARDREALSTLAGTGGSQNLFSGGAAGFPLDTLEYRVGKVNLGETAPTDLAPRLSLDRLADGTTQIGIVWNGKAEIGGVVVIVATDPATGETFQLAAPAEKGFAVLPASWTANRNAEAMTVSLSVLGPDRRPLVADIPVNR
jgi:hypothetical protein